MLPDGATIRIDEHTAYEPDCLVHEGPRLPDETLEVPNPIVVCEVLPPSTRHSDLSAKLIGYFTRPTIAHYMIVDPAHRMVVRFVRDAAAGNGLAKNEHAARHQPLGTTGLTLDIDALLAA